MIYIYPQGLPFERGDYILLTAMMFLSFITLLLSLKPALSKTMRSGDQPTFILLLIASLFYLIYYLLQFLAYTFGPHENLEWKPSVGYAVLVSFGVSLVY